VRAGRGRPRLASLLLAAAVLVGAPTGVLPASAQQDQDADDTEAASELAPPPTPVLGPAPDGWPTVDDLDVAAYLLVEGASGQILAGRDVDERRPVASTVKVLTALTLLERRDLDDEVTVGEEVVGVPGSGVGLAPGDTWTVEELVDALIARSGNDAAEAVAVHVAGDVPSFVALMQADAVAMGLEEPPLVSPSGLDDANLLSALDLATISRVALAHPELGPALARGRVVLPFEGSIETRNELLLTYQGATGVKTGFTAAAGNSLIGSASRGGRELLVVVLGAGEDPARFDLAAALLDVGFDETTPVELGADLELAVAGGAVDLEVAPVTVTAPVDAEVTLSVPLPRRVPDEPVTVPILVDGEPLGVVEGQVDTSGLPAPVEGTAALGRAAVDGAYAALRAASEAGTLR
jgi:D-alanyl-D-alanine carboxypeptidase (penicillin-binding protein 5/6)